jgi:Secretion system C-terminal sorting domain
VDTFFNVPGTYFIVNNVPFEADTKFSLSTNCGNGETSSRVVIVFDKIILEVTTGGLVPINPQPFPCLNMNYVLKKWVGFKVSSTEFGGTSNLFQFKLKQSNGTSTMQIKRVNYTNPIVAVDFDNRIPDIFDPELGAPNPFFIKKMTSTGLLAGIGSVLATLHPPFVDLCKSNDPWNNSYIFTPMYANAVIEEQPIQEPSHGRGSTSTAYGFEAIKVQSPFSETLNVIMNWSTKQEGCVNIRLLNMNGQIILEQKVKEPVEQFSIPVQEIPTGFYLLRLETMNTVQTYKVLKID